MDMYVLLGADIYVIHPCLKLAGVVAWQFWWLSAGPDLRDLLLSDACYCWHSTTAIQPWAGATLPQSGARREGDCACWHWAAHTHLPSSQVVPWRFISSAVLQAAVLSLQLRCVTRGSLVRSGEPMLGNAFPSCCQNTSRTLTLIHSDIAMEVYKKSPELNLLSPSSLSLENRKKVKRST